MSLLPNITYANPNTPLWSSATGSGSNVSNGNISSLYGYDQYTIYSSTFNDDNIQFTFANNYAEQTFLSDGSNTSRITSGTNGLTLEAYYLQPSPLAQGPRDVTLQTFDTTTGRVLSAGLDVATSSFLVSTTNGIISQTGTISSLNLTALNIDSQILTADPTTLFLNGVPLVTQASISSLSQWALDPALSTIQGNNNDLIDVRAGFFSSITANGIQTNTLTAISTIQSFNYLSTTLVNADLVSAAAVIASTFNGYTVSDFLSTSPSQYDPNPLFSTITMNGSGWISTPELFTSSINGAEFTGASGGGIQVSSLVTASISSIVGDVNLQLVSTLQFRPEFKVDFNFDLAPIGEGIKSGLTRIGVGIAGGLAAVGTGIATAALGRSQTTNIYNNSSNFEMINTTTQLQFSTFNYDVSSIYRFVSSSGEPDLVPGEEIFVSTIIPAGAVVVRSMSDPVNLLDPSTFTSTIQSFGQWVEVPIAGSVSTFVDLVVLSNTSTQTLNVDYINGYSGTNIYLGGNPSSGSFASFDTVYSILQLDTTGLGQPSAVNVDSIAVDTLSAKNGTRIDVTGTAAFTLSNTQLITSTVQIGPSTIIEGDQDIPALVARNAQSLSTCQMNASAYVVGDPQDIFQGAYSYSSAFNRATVVNSSIQTKYVAYLDDLQNIQNNSVSTAKLIVSSINNTVYQPFAGGQYFRTSNQNLPTGNNSLIFDASKPWNSTDFVQTDPSTFLCSTTGTYQIGLNTTILAATGTWTNVIKSLLIQQDRGGAQSVVVNTTSVTSPQNYGQSASAVIDIAQGDKLRFITGQTLATGSTISLGLANVFDYNTFWDYQLLRKN